MYVVRAIEQNVLALLCVVFHVGVDCVVYCFFVCIHISANDDGYTLVVIYLHIFRLLFRSRVVVLLFSSSIHKTVMLQQMFGLDAVLLLGFHRLLVVLLKRRRAYALFTQ